jgi:hypothetical protein
MHAEAAELQAVLEGVPLPAEKHELIEYARSQDGGSRAAALLERLPDRSYDRLDDVGEALAPVQPSSNERDAALPRDESGEPPGGDAYTRTDTDPGAVRPSAPRSNPPKKAIQQQTSTQKEQQQRQQAMLGDEKS